MLNLAKVHEIKRVKTPQGQYQEVVTKVNPAFGISAQSNPPIWAQFGKFWSEDGTEIKKLPDWAWAEIEKMSEEAFIAAGFEKKPPKGESPKSDKTISLKDK